MAICRMRQLKKFYLLFEFGEKKFQLNNVLFHHLILKIYIYLTGFHQTQIEDKIFLTAVTTDSHRMSISKIRLKNKIEFDSIILPKKKTIFQLCS